MRTLPQPFEAPSAGPDGRRSPDEKTCSLCGSPDVWVFFEMPDVPVHVGVQWPSREAALACPRGDLVIGYCPGCGFIQNLAFDPNRVEYERVYENALDFSGVFRAYSRSLAERLIERYALNEKHIIEIGCGRGDFLRLMCRLGNNRGVGFDPSLKTQGIEVEKGSRVLWVKDTYSETYADYPADLICCRHVFEHVPNPGDFLRGLRQTIGNREGVGVYFEVPNAAFILRDHSVWDLIYEHCSYFTRESLERAFTSCGFEVCQVQETYEGQFLAIEARAGNGKEGVGGADVSGETEALVQDAAVALRCKLDMWNGELERLEREGQQAVVWGAGAKAVSFLNVLDSLKAVSCAVDINPRKQGRFIAGTGLEIVHPAFLGTARPDVVIVMNPIYADEIQETVWKLGLKPRFLFA